MSRVLLSCFVAQGDADLVAETLRDFAQAPVHQRREAVHGRDFGDAGTGERVWGTLARVVLEVELPQALLADAVSALSVARRRLPLRWRATAIVDEGRIE